MVKQFANYTYMFYLVVLTGHLKHKTYMSVT